VWRNFGISLIALLAAAMVSGCSVHVQDRPGGVDVSIEPTPISIQTHGETGSEPVEIALPDNARSVELTLNQGIGTLHLDGDGDSALSGQVGYYRSAPEVRTSSAGDHFRMEILGERNVTISGGSAPRTILHLGADLPTRLTVHAGVGDAEIDLTEIPATDLTINAGVGEVTVLVPAERNVRIHLSTGLGEHNFRDEGFVKRGSDWVSPDFAEEDVLEIRLEAGLGSFSVERR